MPYSDESPRPWVLQALRERGGLDSVSRVTDVGAGAGAWLDFLQPHVPGAAWTAVEIWEEYILRFRLLHRYDAVMLADARELRPFPAADLTIFGDVLEHMTSDDAVACWEAALPVSRWVVASLPVFARYEQGAEFGNPHEEHLHHWGKASFWESFKGVVASSPRFGDSCAGAFLARGDVA